jgi:hypothetical protein
VVEVEGGESFAVERPNIEVEDADESKFGDLVDVFRAYCDKFRPLDSRPKAHVS